MKYFRFLILAALLAPLPACQTMDGMAKDFQSIKMPSVSGERKRSQAGNFVYDGACPYVETVSELSYLSEFAPGMPMDPQNLASSVEITNVQDACSYDEQSVTIDTTVNFQGMLGPRGQSSANSPYYSYPFFVAVTSADGRILAKEVFSVTMNYAPGQNSLMKSEKMRQVIPIENRDRGSRYKILVGLQLNPDQLAYNRQQIALKEAEMLRAQQAAQAPSPYQQQTQIMQEQAQKEIYIGRPVTITP